MNIRVLSFVLFFVALMVAPRIVEPAYYFYLVAFAALLGLQCEWHGIPAQIVFKPRLALLLFFCAVGVTIVVSINNAPLLRDVLRDLGAIFAFVVGRWLFIAYRSKPLQYEVLTALSAMGVVVALVTLGGAALAYRAGASAYLWRGEYVLWAHTWLPYAIVANVALVTVDSAHRRRYIGRAALCAIGTLASLSRTDLLLEIVFALVLIHRFRRQLFLRFAGFGKLLTAFLVVSALVPMFLQLQVVQQRVDAGVGPQDQSLGWRFMEHLALFDYFRAGSLYDQLFGFGLGARVPLPPGIVDFNDNTSIPTLHNSFGTIALKFGVVGLVVVGWYVLRNLRRSLALRDPAGEPLRQAGRWIVLLCLAKALTLHALTEWSHVVFFGIGCMLMLSPLRCRDVATFTAQPVLAR